MSSLMPLPLLRATRSRRICAAVAGIALSMLAASVWVLLAEGREAARLQREKMELSSSKLPVATLTEAPKEAADFTRQLSHGPGEGEVLAELQRAAAASHLALAEVQFHDRKIGNAASLGHASVSVSVKGNYAGIKSMLKEVLDRLPGTSVDHFSLRRSGGADGSIESTWLLSLWSAPNE